MSRDAWTPTPEQLILLRRNLTDYFSDDELRALCSEIGVDYERLRGQIKAAKASELVRTLAARGRIPELVAHASRLRPDVWWGDLAAEAGSPRGRPAPSKSVLATLGWLVVVLIVLAGLVFVLSGGLRLGRQEIAPGPAPGTSSPVPTTIASAAPTLTPTEIAVTATPRWTPVPLTETSTPPMITATPEQAPTVTSTLPVLVSGNVSRTVTLLAPVNGACVKSLAVTFKWSGAALWPGESFVVAIAPSQVNKARCTSNYTEGVQTSPPLASYEWTTDITAPSKGLAACAGSVEWTVYIRNAAGNVTQAAPAQYFEWNPLSCK